MDMYKQPDLKDWGNGYYFDIHHYGKVMRARKEKSLPVYDKNNVVLHPLIGKQLRLKSTGKVYNVEICRKEWLLGWYYKLLLENNGSHVVVAWEIDDEPTSTVCDLTLRQIKENQEDFEVIK